MDEVHFKTNDERGRVEFIGPRCGNLRNWKHVMVGLSQRLNDNQLLYSTFFSLTIVGSPSVILCSPSNMPPSNVQGLNEIDTTTTPKSFSSDSRDLLNFPNYSDFNAQLDLWTTISFESEDHLLRKGDSSHSRDGKSSGGDGDDDESSKDSDILYPGDAHENVVTGIPLPTQNTPSAPASGSRQVQQPLDLAALLGSFGVNPLGIQLQQQLQQQLQMQQSTPAGPTIPANMPALAQLLSLPLHTSPQAQTPIPTSPVSDVQGQLNKQSPPAPKRTRVTKSPTDTVVASINSPSEYNSPTPLNPAEDKRRRNTAASARFRLKKKEREAALEKKAKELEVKVSALEKECEGLRRENGWLKGLVVGVTGVAAPPQLSSLDIRTGTKRQREDDGAGDR